MMKKFLKSLSLVMALVMCFTMVFTAAVSADEATPTITFGVKDSVEPGAVSITVDAANFADVAGVQGEITVAGLDDAAVVAGTIDNVVIDAGVISFAEEGEANDEGTKITMADGTLFTITGTAVEGTNITLAWTADETKACDTAEKLLTLDYADKTVEVKKAVVEPEEPTLDENITITPSISVDATLQILYIVQGVKDYADFEIAISANRIDADNGFNFKATTDTITKAEMTYASDDMYYFIYDGIAMYELNVPLVSTVKAVDAAGKEFVSNENTTSIKAVAAELYASVSAVKTKTLLADLMILGEEAQKYFAPAGSDLAGVAYPTVDFDLSLASVDYGTLTNINSATGAGTITPSIDLALNPGMLYIIGGVSDASDLTAEVSYYDAVKKTDVVNTFDVADGSIVDAGGIYYFQYKGLSLSGGASEVTTKVYEGENLLVEHHYCLETCISENIGTARIADILTAIAKFGKSAQAYFGI